MSEIIITKEMKEDASKCNKTNCDNCKMYAIRSLPGGIQNCVEAFASLPGVWDGAPEDAKECHILYCRDLGVQTGHIKSYSRTLPKTRAREIAEERAQIFCSGGKSIHFQEALADSIESAINEALKDN